MEVRGEEEKREWHELGSSMLKKFVERIEGNIKFLEDGNVKITSYIFVTGSEII